jgi:hypothetical protein
MRGASKEEKVATAIAKTLTDFTLDLEAVGFYLAKATPYLIFRRAMEVLESAEYQSEGFEYNTRGKYYADNVRRTV